MTRATMSRANSYAKATLEHQDCWEQQAFLFACLSLMNGWAKFAEEFWSPKPSGKQPVVVAAHDDDAAGDGDGPMAAGLDWGAVPLVAF